MTLPTQARTLAAAAIALALLALPACDRNRAGTVLAPTGIRPAPAVWPGSVSGLVFFDPLNAPDLAAPPYPPTRVELWRGGTRMAVDSLSPASRSFRFEGVPSGQYSVVARSSGFFDNSVGGINVGIDAVDAGDIRIAINPGSFSSGMEIIGTIPGFRVTDLDPGFFPIDVSELSTSSLGTWDYPSLDYPGGQSIPAGTYRFKFATDWPASATQLTGWGDGSGVTLTAPVTDHPAVLGTGLATDINMTFPVTGTYAFRLDERRHTFSVNFLYGPGMGHPALAARR